MPIGSISYFSSNVHCLFNQQEMSLNQYTQVAKIGSVSDNVAERLNRAAEHVAMGDIEPVGPSHPGKLITNVRAENIGSGDRRQMRIVDANYSGGSVGDWIVNNFPVVFRCRNNVIVVGIFGHVNWLLNAVDVGQRQDVVSASVNHQVTGSANGQITNSKFQRFPVSVVERLPLRGSVDVVVTGVLTSGVNKVTVRCQVTASEIVTLTDIDVLDGQIVRANDVGHTHVLTGLAVASVRVYANIESSFAERRTQV